MTALAEVAVLAPVGGTFTYVVPHGLVLSAGTRVWVPFGGRSAEAVVLRTDVAAPPPPFDAATLKAISGRIEAPPLDPPLVELARWIADYYIAPPGEALRLLLPPGGRANEVQIVRLTREGKHAAAGIGQALEPTDLEGLGLRERDVLKRLHAAHGEHKLRNFLRDVEGAKAAIGVLEKRKLVEIAREVKVRRERFHEIVRALPPVPDAVAKLARAPKRRALYERITAAGEIALDDLRAVDKTAREQVAALAGAGLCFVEQRSASAPRAPHVDPFTLVPVAPTEPHVLTAAQAFALGEIAPPIESSVYTAFLLHGATGSGKTEVYLRAIQMAMEQGKGALVLVPEISLTPQLASRFRGRFGDAVAVLHSNLGDRDRFEAWLRLRTGAARIALGARSAVFAPVPRLGVVVIDEEHDGSFKQEEGLHYHARDVAVRRARDAGAVAILGSATPSMETFEAARAGRITLLSLPERATRSPLPAVQVIDLRQYKSQDGTLITAPLAAALDETLGAGEQAILFLNRRGFSTFVLCTACGHRFTCRNCAVTLTFHRGDNRLACHYCGYLEPTPARCPRCLAQSIERLGLGTERLEAEVAQRFPRARIARLDRDTAQGSGLERILAGIRDRQFDIVVGTQMLAKGHDFPAVTLVGVILADTGMSLPDFRAAERTFQLLAQVAGRAGRGDRPGRVLIQTFTPEHPAVVCAREHDYLRFFDEERVAREEHHYPPLARVALIRFDGAHEQDVEKAAHAAAAAMLILAARAPAEARVAILGPAEAPLSRLKGKTRWQLLLKAANHKAIKTMLLAGLAVEPPRGVRVQADVDPVSML